MEIILTNLYEREFFENGGIITTTKGQVINDYNVYKENKINPEDIISAKIGNKNYIYDKKDERFNYSDIRNFLEPKDPYGIKNVCFSLMEEGDSRWGEFKKQRLEQGFDDSETWALDHTIASFILPRLKCFYNNGNIMSHPYGLTNKKWNKIVSKMVQAFDLIVNTDAARRTDKEHEVVNEGLDLFREYFFDLWD